jgi:predicted esterase
MKSLGLISVLLLLIINVSYSSVDDEARALMKKIEKEDKIQDVGIYIIKNGKERSIIECYAKKKLASEAACRKVVEYAITQLESQTKTFIQQMKNSGKWQDIINYVKQNGVEVATDACTRKKLTYKAICYNVAVIASKETSSSSSSSFRREKKSDGSIYLTPQSGKYTHVLIFLHGITGSPEHYIDKFDNNEGIVPNTFKIILPAAPGKSWFDIQIKYGAPIDYSTINTSELEKSSKRIKSIINDEVKYLKNDYSKIFVGGFSQGSCLAYEVGLSFDHLLGGIACFCAVPYNRRTMHENNKNNLKILAYLGKNDPCFPIKQAEKTIKSLFSNNRNLLLKEYNVGHEISNDGLKDLNEFLVNNTK